MPCIFFCDILCMVRKMKDIKIYTDGACSGNPGPGGWGAVLIYENNVREISGFDKSTTNNKMEMLAVIESLKLIKYPCNITIYSDSAYVVNAFEKKWVDKWQTNNWKTADKKDVKNVELWKELITLLNNHKYAFVKVKGHSDNELNNRCDELATGEIEKNR